MATGRWAQDGLYDSGGKALYGSGTDEDEEDEDEEYGGMAGDDEEGEEEEEEEENPLARSVVQVGQALPTWGRAHRFADVSVGERDVGPPYWLVYGSLKNTLKWQ